MRTLAAAVLGFEALVIVFAATAAMRSTDLATGTVWEVGGAGAVLAVVLAGLLRFRWAYGLGSLFQLVLVASGALVPVMYFVGGVFALLWIAALHYGHKADVIRARRAAEAEAAATSVQASSRPVSWHP